MNQLSPSYATGGSQLLDVPVPLGYHGAARERRTMPRQEELIAELEHLVAKLAEDPHCRRAILFGSLAADEVHETSDIDLIVIQETPLPFWQRMREMRRRLAPRVATDLFVYTPEEFEQLCRERPFFRGEVLARCRVVYERA